MTTPKRKNLKNFEYQGEANFWYFLTVNLHQQVKSAIPQVLESLNSHLDENKIGFRFDTEKSVVMAVICQIYFLSNKETQLSFFERMDLFAGVKKSVPFQETVEEVFREIQDKLQTKSLMNRTEEEIVREVFISKTIVFRNATDEKFALLEVIFSRCKVDPTILIDLNSLIYPIPGFWFEITRYYVERRPGFFRRLFSDPDKWLFK